MSRWGSRSAWRCSRRSPATCRTDDNPGGAPSHPRRRAVPLRHRGRSETNSSQRRCHDGGRAAPVPGRAPAGAGGTVRPAADRIRRLDRRRRSRVRRDLPSHRSPARREVRWGPAHRWAFRRRRRHGCDRAGSREGDVHAYRGRPGLRMNTNRPTLLADARLIDPASGRDGRGSVLVRDGVIADVAWGAPAPPEGATVVDCGGQVLTPGLVDMRAFIGEPGAEHRETLKTASEAAAAGGVTTLVCMPDTNPVIDDPAIVDFVRRRARDTAIVNIRPAAALTKGLHGREMTEIGLLGDAGAIAFTDGARSVTNAQVMRRALTYARDFGALIIHHVEDPDLVGQGVMNEGEFSARLGLHGVPREAETVMLERDIRLVRLTGARYHAAMISCADSVDIVRRAKADGLAVTCGVSINNLTLNENDIGDYRTFCKLSPPLRHEDDRQAVIAALAEGVIDVIVSDHNPQDVETKRRPFAEAADGALGLETLLSAGLRLVHADQIALPKLLYALSTRPADILGLPSGRLQRGAPADLILLDPDAPYVLDKRTLRSRSKNSPFDEARLDGQVLVTIVGGRVVHDRRGVAA